MSKNTNHFRSHVRKSSSLLTHTLYHSPILTQLQQLTILKSFIYKYSPNISDTSNHSGSTSRSFHMFNLQVTCQRTPTISDLFLFSPDVQPLGNYSLYNIVQEHFTIYLSLNKTSENSYNSSPCHFQFSDHRILQSTT